MTETVYCWVWCIEGADDEYLDLYPDSAEQYDDETVEIAWWEVCGE